MLNRYLYSLRLLATRVSCPTDPPAEMMKCLRTVSAHSLSEAAGNPWPNNTARSLLTFGWGAVFDGDFLPRDAIKPGAFKGDVMLTVNANEGSILYWQGQKLASSKPRTDIDAMFQCKQFSEEYIRSALKQYFHQDPPKAAITATADLYINCSNNSVKLSDAMLLHGDQQYISPALEYIHAHITTGHAYLYYFDHDVPAHWGQAAIFRGANHAEDQQYLAGLTHRPALDPNIAKKEKTLSDIMMTYFANFIKTGNPNLPSSVPIAFPEYNDVTGQSVLHMNSELLATPINKTRLIDSHFLSSRMSLWLEQLPLLMKSDQVVG